MCSLLLTVFFGTSDFWNSTVRVTCPIALAAVACILTSRAGVLFVGVEGVMLISAFFSIAGVVWTGSIALGVVFAIVAGVVTSLFFGFLSMTLRMGDVVGGLVVHVLSIGLTAFLVEQWFSAGATIGALSLGPSWGSTGNHWLDIVAHQQPLTYFTVIGAISVAIFLRTRLGLVVRSSGESVSVAQTLGIKLVRLRYCVLAAAGTLLGLAGVTIGLAIIGTFDTSIASGRGFIALACVILGAWRPLAVLAASLLFGIAYAVQFRVGAAGQWMQLLPYVVTLLAIALFWGRTQGPAEEGLGLPNDSK